MSRALSIKTEKFARRSHFGLGRPAGYLRRRGSVTGCDRFTALGPRRFERNGAPMPHIERTQQSNRRRSPDRAHDRHLGIVGNEGRSTSRIGKVARRHRNVRRVFDDSLPQAARVSLERARQSAASPAKPHPAKSRHRIASVSSAPLSTATRASNTLSRPEHLSRARGTYNANPQLPLVVVTAASSEPFWHQVHV
jgi:hypothetical protein